MEEHYLKVIEDDVECLDCIIEPEVNDDTIEESTEKESTIKVTVDKTKSTVDYIIDDEDGVNIEINDN